MVGYQNLVAINPWVVGLLKHNRIGTSNMHLLMTRFSGKQKRAKTTPQGWKSFIKALYPLLLLNFVGEMYRLMNFMNGWICFFCIFFKKINDFDILIFKKGAHFWWTFCNIRMYDTFLTDEPFCFTLYLGLFGETFLKFLTPKLGYYSCNLKHNVFHQIS